MPSRETGTPAAANSRASAGSSSGPASLHIEEEGWKVTVHNVPLARYATLPWIEQAVRAALDADLVLIETGHFVSSVNESALHIARVLGYATRIRRDGALMTGFPVGGLPTRLDLLEDAGLRCVVVSAKAGLGQVRRVVYVTGDRRSAPRPRSAAEVLGLEAADAADAELKDPRAVSNEHRLAAGSDHDPSPDRTEAEAEAETVETDEERIAKADQLLDVRVALLHDLWTDFLERGDAHVLSGLRAGDALQRYAQELVRRPVRRRRKGDEEWTPELDRVLEESYTAGRLTAETARKVDRPTVLTEQRLSALGYPDKLWPAWDVATEVQLRRMVELSTHLQQVSRTLKRSPWDITRFIALRHQA